MILSLLFFFLALLKILGRGEEITTFIKTGFKDGYTEIELKSMPGEPNVTIKRALFRDKKPNSRFWINGMFQSGGKPRCF